MAAVDAAPASAPPAITVDAAGAVRWTSADGSTQCVEFDVEGDAVLTTALLRSMLRPAAAGGIYVRWSRSPDRVALLAVYDTLEAAGVNVHPPRGDGIAAYDHLRERANDPPAPRPKRPRGEVVPAAPANAVAAVVPPKPIAPLVSAGAMVVAAGDRLGAVLPAAAAAGEVDPLDFHVTLVVGTAVVHPTQWYRPTPRKEIAT